jgi:hypothetical protein
VSALVSCFLENTAFDNFQKKVIVPPPPFFIYITEIDEKGRKVFTVQEDRNLGIKYEPNQNELSGIIMKHILHMFSLDIAIILHKEGSLIKLQFSI